MCYTKPHFTCLIKFPQNLTHLDLSYSAFQLATIPRLALMSNNSLKFVYLSYNSIWILPKSFYCVRNTKPVIKLLNLSNNKIECINSSYFSHCDWSSLNVLNLKQNHLKQILWRQCNTEDTYFLSFLKPVQNLTELDLSGNKLETEMQFKTFENQSNLRELYLSDMGLSMVTIQISHTTKLQNLDISSNKLKCLSKQTMSEMANLSLSSKKYANARLHVNLQNNSLQCSCECYSFLKWFRSANILFTEKQLLSCILNKSTYRLTDIDKILTILNATCFPEAWFHVMIGTV